jgi:glycosyltransferase involved in cell wall biosynthesis
MPTEQRPFRLAIVAPLPVQYNSPFFARLAEEPDIEPVVLYGTLAHTYESFDEGFGISYSWDIPLLEGYRYKIIPTLKKTDQDHGPALISPRLIFELRRSNYDGALIYGWGDWFSRTALLACIVNRLPFFITGDATPLYPERPLRGSLKHFFQACLVRQAAGCLYLGSLQRVYFERLGVDESKLFFHPYAVDNDRFFAAATNDRAQKNKLRADFGLPPDIPLIVFCGKFIKRKRPMDVLSALSALQSKGIECGAVFIGGGQLEPLLESVVTREDLKDVYFLGFVNQSQLPNALAACDVLVLPSDKDPRATVVAEAMATGLPVVISHRVGLWGYGDIVIEGETGFVFSCRDVNRLTSDLEKLVTDEDLRVRMGSAALERMKTWGMAERVEGIRKAIESLS